MAFLFFDVNPEAFRIPFFNWPIMWYGILFALGFFLGYYICISFLKRYLIYFPQVDIPEWTEKSASGLARKLSQCEDHKLVDIKSISTNLRSSHSEVLAPPKSRFFSPFGYKSASFIVDKLTFYMIIATLIGARLGHLLFYEKPSSYLLNPLEILKVWKGGLASHGAAVAIIVFLFFFARSLKKMNFNIGLVGVLDIVSLPTAFAAIFIRIGNFMNQEILGKVTTVPWAITFGHPVDGIVAPRHPVQLYEALFYLIAFFILLYFSYLPKFFLKKGFLIGLFLLLIFGFRFFIEFFKEEQSTLISSCLTMGQYLSLPFIALGLFYMCKRH